MGKKELDLRPLSYDITDEAKARIYSEWEPIALTLSERLAGFIEERFERHKIPYRSISKLMLLMFPNEVIAVQSILRKDYWILCEQRIQEVSLILELIKNWLKNVSERNELEGWDFSEIDIVWKEWSPRGKEFHLIVPFILKKLEGKQFEVTISDPKPRKRKFRKKNSKKSTQQTTLFNDGSVIAEESAEQSTDVRYSLRFVREIPDWGTNDVQLVSEVISREMEVSVKVGSGFQKRTKNFHYSLILRLSVESRPEKTLGNILVFTMSVRKYANRDIAEEIMRKTLTRTVVLIPKRMDRPIIRLGIKERDGEWNWVDRLNEVLILTELTSLELPPVYEACSVRSLLRDKNGFYFGLIHHTQDFYNHKVQSGVPLAEKVMIYDFVYDTLLQELGFQKSHPWVRYTNTVLKGENLIPQAMIEQFGRSYTDLERKVDKDGHLADFRQITSQNNPKVLFLLPSEVRSVFKEVIKLFWQDPSTVTFVTLERYFLAGYTDAEKPQWKRKLTKFLLEVLIPFKESGDLYIVYYAIRSKEDYKFSQGINDPRNLIRSAVLSLGGVPKQISVPKEEGKLNDAFKSKLIVAMYDYFRLIGRPRYQMEDLKFKDRNFSYAGVRLYKAKPKNRRTLKKAEYYLTIVLVDVDGSIKVFLQNTHPIEHLEAYKRILKNDVPPITTIAEVRTTLKSFLDSYANKDLLLFVDPNNIKGVKDVIASLSNINLSLNRILFASKRTEKYFYPDEDYLTTQDYPKLRIIRSSIPKTTNHEFPVGYVLHHNKVQQGTGGLCLLEPDEKKPQQFFAYSVGGRPATAQNSVIYRSKWKDPDAEVWIPQTLELTVIMKQEEDTYFDLLGWSHLSRLIPTVIDTEVARPFPLYLAERLKRDLASMMELEEAEDNDGRRMSQSLLNFL